MPARKLKISDQSLAAFSDAGRAAAPPEHGRRNQSAAYAVLSFHHAVHAAILHSASDWPEIKSTLSGRHQRPIPCFSTPAGRANMLKKEVLKSKNGNGVDSEPLVPWCDLLKSCTSVWSLNDTTALLTVNSVTVCVKFI